MAFVDEQKRVVGDVFEQGRRRLAGIAAGEITRIVFDAGAGAGGFEHFDIVTGALFEALGFEQATALFQLGKPVLQLFLDLLDRAVQRRARGDIVRVGVDFDRLQVAGLLAGERVELGDRVDLVAEHRDAPCGIFKVGREDFNGVAADPERAADEIDVLALVLLGDEIGEQLALVEPVADFHLEGHRRVGFDRTDTIDAGDRCDDDAVVALQQRAGGGVAHAVDLFVDRRFLLDEGVGARHIGFRLVIIVIGDEIFDRVVREEILELGIELRGQRLVGREDDGGALGFLDHLGHGEGFARAGNAEQDLAALVVVDALDEIGDRGRLVAGGLVFRRHADGDAAFGFRRAFGPVRRPQLAVLEQRIAAFDQGGEGFDSGGDGAGGEALRVLQRDIEARDGIETGCGTGFRVGRGADRHAAGGFAGRRILGGLAGGFGRFLRLGSVLFRLAQSLFAGGDLDLLAVLAGLGGDLALGLDPRRFRFRLQLLHPVGHTAFQRCAFKG
ncbi:hypothetical protein D3C73_646360 [compost metagenome]